MTNAAAASASAGGPGSAPRAGRQVVLITVVALAVFVGFRALPTGTNINHMDFRLPAGEVEYCDPLNPQFIPVVAVRSPVTLAVQTPRAPEAGQTVAATMRLETANGKPIGPADLLVAHTRKLHLMIVDPTLRDYQHVHPEPAEAAGEWRFAFTPRLAGVYRIFADFTPAATSRSLYASADLAVTSAGAEPVTLDRPDIREPNGPALPVVELEGFRFRLTPQSARLQAGEPIDLAFAVEQSGGGPVPLQPIMGAFAHLVAFDRDRSGFAHLHPNETDLARPPDARHPVLNFKITIPRGGRYVIWAQVNLGGNEVFVPFSFQVGE